MKDGSTISAEKLAERFYTGFIGQAMYDQPLRYTTNFGYEREDMRHDLGHDLCPIGHQMELPHHIAKIIEAEQTEGSLFGSLSDEEIGIVMLACLLHDSGETTHPAITQAGLKPVGDIPAGCKTPEDRQNETAVRQFLWEAIYADVDPVVMERVEAIIAHQDNTHLHDLFEAGHLAQTLETSNFAYHRLMSERWHREGEVIDLRRDDAARLSGLLGIMRVVHASAQKHIPQYEHLVYIRTIANESAALRYPEHRLM